MKKKYIAPITALLLALVYSYIGYNYTWYRMGIFLVPLVFLVAGFLCLVSIFIVKAWKRKGWFIFFIYSSILFVGLITGHVVENYKPTITINIPDHYEGMVHIFTGNTSAKQFWVDNNGIAYCYYEKEAKWKIKHGKKDISGVLNEYGRTTLEFSSPDSMYYYSTSVVCFEVESGREYPTSPWNQKHAKCMDKVMYLHYVEAGIVDDSKVVKKKWKYEQ
jgi:hypothetical protein